ncbi:Lipoprotein signal peptidase [Desulfovibrio sp. X2]|uniref:signal peptidase II n=1 Tax=Desulfovibrio sp. X2 TaxID=941449 RepID=UPI000358D969|nr:signal peptidase II [Desulfovibrio sp. X2]EPR42262.1 Lipoprotein signal peptidase [Desulfovibrio sp. X2]
MQRRYAFVLGLAAVVLAADQASKAAVRAHIGAFERIPVIPGFLDLVNVGNRGAAFGFLNRADWSWPSLVFAGVSLVALGVILWLVKSARDRVSLAALALIMGGAVGNLVDRLRFGFVVDFIDAYVGELHWPAFNVADSAICVGAVLLAWRMLGHGARD